MRRGSFASEEFYHIYNRGTERRDIFLDDFDRDRFIALLYLCNSAKPVRLQRGRGRTSTTWAFDSERGGTLVDLVAYCLMPNHVHLLVRCKDEADLSLFMQKLMTAYTMYFNRKYDRTGVLFQGKFKSSHVDSDRYLKYLLSYIHLNPVKLIEPGWKETGIADRRNAESFLRTYRYSSYPDYIGHSRPEGALINKEIFLEYSDIDDFSSQVSEWLAYK